MSKSKRQPALTASSIPVRTPHDHADHRYEAFELLVAKQIGSITEPMFTTNIGEDQLWDAYINSIPSEYRQHYTCHACRTFVQRYGGLVTIDDYGDLTSAVWANFVAPLFFVSAVERLYRLARYASVTGVFLPTGVLGTPKTGQWTHLHGVPAKPYSGRHPPPIRRWLRRSRTSRCSSTGFGTYNKSTAEQALRVLKADALDRSEKTLGVAQWFFDLHEALSTHGISPSRYVNIIWKAVATAPAGFCHIRSSMISTLLDDIVTGLSFDAISRRWAEKMHPLQYQRPQAAPKEGNPPGGSSR
jgi:hypothetical protein